MVVINSSSAPVSAASRSRPPRPSPASPRTGCHPVADQGTVLVRPLVGEGLVRCRERDGARCGADAADPQPVAGGEPPGRVVVGADDDVCGDEHLGSIERGRGFEGVPVRLHRLEDRRRRDVVAGPEGQTVLARQLGALSAAAPENPHLHVGAIARAGVGLDPLGVAVVAAEQGENVPDLFCVVRRGRAGLLEEPRFARRTEGTPSRWVNVKGSGISRPRSVR